MWRNYLTPDMEPYRLVDWIILFLIYSFLGWVWESIYMSILEKKPLNRGFLYGPCIPIYGIGATLVIFTTMPFKDKWVLVVLVGMIVGTVMEEIAGRTMEKIFDVKYWSYEGYPGNIDDFICVPATLLWGFFAVMTLYWLNRPFDYLIRHMEDEVLTNISLIGVILFSVDVALSVRNALDFKEVLSKMANAREELSGIRQRLDRMLQLWDEKESFATRWKQKLSDRKNDFYEMLENTKMKLAVLEEIKQNNKQTEDDKDMQDLPYLKERLQEQEVLGKHYFPRFVKHVKRLLYSNPKAKLKKMGVSLKELGSSMRNSLTRRNDEEK